MTQEEKAKAYDELKVKASRIYHKENDVLIMHTIEDLFPELAESEGEKIRERLIDFFEDWHKHSSHCWSIAVTDILDWLEKQGKNNIGISEATKQELEDNLNKALEKETPESWNKFLDGGEQKPAWSEEDKKYNNIVVSALHNPSIEGLYNFHKINRSDVITWFKSLKDRVQPQSQQEWSEEDEKMYQSIMDDTVQENQLNDKQTNWLRDIKYRYFPQPKQEWSKEDEQYLLVCKNALAKYQITDKWDAYIISHWLENKLKSLRPQNTWKPSDEQIRILELSIDYWKPNDVSVTTPLYNLLEQLKKLREE